MAQFCSMFFTQKISLTFLQKKSSWKKKIGINLFRRHSWPKSNWRKLRCHFKQAYILRHGKDLIAYWYITPLKKTLTVPDVLSFVFFSPAKLEITTKEMPLQISWSLKNFIRIYNFYLYDRNRLFLFRNSVLFSCR